MWPFQGRDAASPAAHETRAAIEALGRRCHVIAADMAVPVDATRTVEEAIGALGGIDVLVHAAGASAMGSLLQVSEEVWYHAFNVHVHAVFIFAARPCPT